MKGILLIICRKPGKGLEDGTINGTINDTLYADELAIVKYIETHPGVQVSDIMTFTGKSMRTVKRNIARLVALAIVERRGSRKTGGYYMCKDR